ncbi:hypothetical protein ABT234_08420 [Streptomyces sp. NPDC001586]|uniref:hypothetical protein n=1 Tax=Streptomyces sp. NPDC001586 TaxID=3154387 RepID=UPI00332CD1F0
MRPTGGAAILAVSRGPWTTASHTSGQPARGITDDLSHLTATHEGLTTGAVGLSAVTALSSVFSWEVRRARVEDPAVIPAEEGNPPMTMQQAAERADAILDATFAAVRPPVCWTHRDSQAGTHTTDRRRAVITVIAEERLGGLLGLVERHWTGLGYTLRATSRDGRAAYFLASDGFQLSVVVGWKDQPHFRVTTPPAEPSDVALSTTSPHGPDHRHKKVPEPDQFHPFWSVPQAPPAGG